MFESVWQSKRRRLPIVQPLLLGTKVSDVLRERREEDSKANTVNRAASAAETWSRRGGGEQLDGRRARGG